MRFSDPVDPLSCMQLMAIKAKPMDQHSDNLSRGTTPSRASKPFAEHSRHWDASTYVYPVVSRRSKGLSIGVNLNPDTICNFDCVYCQVEKVEPPRPIPVDTVMLREELNALAAAAASGRIWEHPRFAGVDPSLRRLNDIAFSGDGEPTAAPCFAEAVDIATGIKAQHKLDGVKIVLITNATLLDRPIVASALNVLDAHGGEVWAKLDAGTQDYYDQVDRSAVPLQRVLDNILACGRRRSIVIQSMFLQMHGQPITPEAFNAYADRVVELIEAGCKIKLIQLYTVARKPLEDYVTALSDKTLSDLAQQLRLRLNKVTAAADTAIQVYGSNG